MQPLGTVGYIRTPAREHKLAPRGEKYITVGIAHNYPALHRQNVRTSQIVYRQDVSSHPERSETGGDEGYNH